MNNIKDIIKVFNENISKDDLIKQNKQINVLIENLKNIEKENLKILSEQERSKNRFKINDLISINDEVHYIKDIRFDKPSFPSKVNDNVLIFETINLSTSFTYFVNSRDNKIPTRNLDFLDLKGISYLNNINFDVIKDFFKNNAKYNQIIASRIVFNSTENKFSLYNSNELYKQNKAIIHEIEGMDLIKSKNKNSPSYFQINDFELFSKKYKELYFKINEPFILEQKEYKKTIQSLHDSLSKDLEELKIINDKQLELSSIIFKDIDILNKDLNTNKMEMFR